MPPISIDAELSTRLAAVNTTVDLCDPSGRIVGRFVPLLDLTGWVPLSPGITDEERQRRKKSDEPRYTTAEAKRYLGLDK
ncbi:MAG: hypothetical protein U0793_14955 [Gemmataceae bacterium]